LRGITSLCASPGEPVPHLPLFCNSAEEAAGFSSPST
jgi:hypothetical protein